MTLFLNGLRASSVRRVVPWNGPWSCDVDVDLGETTDLADGPAVLLVDKLSMLGTIDPKQSGRMGPRARARVVAGSGGWEKPVASKHYHNDGAVMSTAVLATTAAEVKERVTELGIPIRLGIDYVREAGLASQVLQGLEWHVDATGTTIVGPRVQTPAPESIRVLEWDPLTRVATLGTDGDILVEPGMLLVDSRFGAAKIRDVEQTWGDGGSRAKVRTIDPSATPGSKAGSELVATIQAIARASMGGLFQTYRYRVQSQGPDGRLYLKAVKRQRDVVPDLKLISIAPSVPGAWAKVAPGTIAHVVFPEGDRTLPRVHHFESGPKPLEVGFDATVEIKLAAPLVTLDGIVQAGANPVLLATETFLQWMAAITTAVNGLAPGSAVLPQNAVSTKLFAD